MPVCCHQTQNCILLCKYCFQIRELLFIFLEKGKAFLGIRCCYTSYADILIWMLTLAGNSLKWLNTSTNITCIHTHIHTPEQLNLSSECKRARGGAVVKALRYNP
jgi:hypothetical protein